MAMNVILLELVGCLTMLEEMVAEINPLITPFVGVGFEYTVWKREAVLGRVRSDMEIMCRSNIAGKGSRAEVSSIMMGFQWMTGAGLLER